MIAEPDIAAPEPTASVAGDDVLFSPSRDGGADGYGRGVSLRRLGE